MEEKRFFIHFVCDEYTKLEDFEKKKEYVVKDIDTAEKLIKRIINDSLTEDDISCSRDFINYL